MAAWRIGPLWLACLGGTGLPLACARPASPTAPLRHEAYVWQRLWTPEVSEAVENAPVALHALRVLAVERGAGGFGNPPRVPMTNAWGAAELGSARTSAGGFGNPPRVPMTVTVDTAALARSRRAVVAVFRIAGTGSLDGVSIDLVARVARAWRGQGVRVRGVEIDHDCATAGLRAYAAWLARAGAELDGLPLSITALPTWVGSPALPDLLASVSDVVVQLHTLAAPVLFDPVRARGFAEAWSRATGREFRVALPTYGARLKDGTPLVSDPAAISSFLADLRGRPVSGLSGIVWFRLGNAGDLNAWGAPTLAAVIRGTPLYTKFAARLVDAGAGTLDVVLENRGNLDGDIPRILGFSGDLEILDGVRGLVARDSSLVALAPTRLPAGASVVVGYVRGRGIQVAIP
jgi:hypothetical protein